MTINVDACENVYYLNISECFWISLDPPFAMTGIDSFSEIRFRTWLRLGCCGLSSIVRPCTAIASIPVEARVSQSWRVFSRSGRIRILQVTGIVTVSINLRKISVAFWGSLRRAAPIPPSKENFFGQPILISMPAISFCIIRATLAALSGSDVPIWRTTWSRSRGQVRNATVPSVLSM